MKMSPELPIHPCSLPAADGAGKAAGSGDVVSHMPALACGMPQARPCQRQPVACRSHEAGAWDAFHPSSKHACIAPRLQQQCLLCHSLP